MSGATGGKAPPILGPTARTMSAAPVAFTIAVDPDSRVAAKYYAASLHPAPPAVLVFAHGAGAGHSSPFIVAFATAFAALGLDVVSFNFPYIEARRRMPDRNEVLEATWRAALTAVGERLASHRVFAGGKSMGGRIASQVAAAGLSDSLAGLIFFGYPLHPPGRPNERRDRHLAQVKCPMLFVQGERDPFGNAGEMRELVAVLPRAELYAVANANHSLEPPKRAALESREELFAAIQDRVAAWVRSVTKAVQ